MTIRQLKPIIGSCFYAGFLPNAPGTWGSFVALFPIYPIAMLFPTWGVAAFALISSVLTVWVSSQCERVWGSDPSPLVMDEWAGQGVAFIAFPFTGFVPTDLLWLVLGFIFFRFFDIKKPLGVNKLQQLPGAWGILIDDLLAGFYGFICLKIVIFVTTLF